MTRSFAADPTNNAACKLVRTMSHGDWISVLVSCVAAVNASLAMLGNVATVRWLTEYGDPTFFDIGRVVVAGIGTFLLWQVAFRLLPLMLFRKHLQEGTILKLDDTIVNLDLSKCEDPAAVAFKLQQDRNAYLQRYAERLCHQQ